MKIRLIRKNLKARTLIKIFCFCIVALCINSFLLHEKNYFGIDNVRERKLEFERAVLQPIEGNEHQNIFDRLGEKSEEKNSFYQNENVYFCEVIEVGCYDVNNLPKHKITRYSNAFMTKSFCFHFCGTRAKNDIFAMLHKGSECICTDRFDRVARIAKPSNQCDKPCSGYAEKTCGGNNQVDVYRVKPPCFDSNHVPSTFAKSRFRGCSHLVSHENRFLNMYSLTSCILYCSLKKQVFSLWHAENNQCYCRNYQEQFTPIIEPSICDETSLGVFRTLSQNGNCYPIKFLPPTVQVKRFALASDPGAGNTWTRHLIEIASGIYTGSIYGDRSLFFGGFLGEAVPMELKKHFLIKDHLFIGRDLKDYDGAIFIIRNPFKAAIAEFTRQRSSHTGIINPKLFYSQKFANAHLNCFPDKRLQTIIDAKKPYYIMIYEQMLEDPIGETRKVMQFLHKHSGFKQDDLEERLKCLKDDLAGSFKRKPATLPKDPFSKEAKIDLNNKISRLRKLLIKINSTVVLPKYEFDLDWK